MNLDFIAYGETHSTAKSAADYCQTTRISPSSSSDKSNVILAPVSQDHTWLLFLWQRLVPVERR